MAFESFPQYDLDFSANADLTSSGTVNPQFCACKLTSTGVAFATAAGNILGIMQDKGASASGRATSVRTVNGTISKALADAGGSGWTAGDNLEVYGTVGGLQTITTGGAKIVAMGIETTTAGNYGAVILKQGQSA